MTPSPKRAEPLSPINEERSILELESDMALAEEAFDPAQWAAEAPAATPGAGGRQVLAWGLSVLAAP